MTVACEVGVSQYGGGGVGGTIIVVMHITSCHP